MSKVYFIGGLPRSGSTLLCNILAQNPRFNATSTSGILDVMFNVRNFWDTLIEFQASPNPEGKKRVLKGILMNYHKQEKPVVFDKSRGHLAYIEMLEHALGEKIKIIVPIRDIKSIMASFEKLHRKTAALRQPVAERKRSDYFLAQSVRGRCEILLREDQPLGLAGSRVLDAIQRGFRDRLHFVDFDNLTSNPETTLKGIYEFLGEEYYAHDFNNVEQVTYEDDDVHGIVGLHDIRPKVEYKSPDWATILGSWAKEYDKFNIGY